MNLCVSKVVATVNAPYGAPVTAAQLAQRIVDPHSAETFDAATFAFLSEVSPSLQHAFIAEMGLDLAKVSAVAKQFEALAGYKVALAA